jgi:hypothetical protein
MNTLEALPVGVPLILYPVGSLAIAALICSQIVAAVYQDRRDELYIVVTL